jgi:methionyl-tRNA formyltransferase
LNVVQPENFKDAQRIKELEELKPDIIVIAAYGRILPDAILNIPRFRCVNIHPSLLPRYRGPSPIAAAILSGDVTTGVTIMLVEHKVDSGPILSQQEMRITDEDTTGTLSHCLAELGADLLIETLPEWTAGRILPVAQDESLASYTRMETREDGALDWRQPAERLWRQVRALSPWPGCYTRWKNMTIKINKVIPVNVVHSKPPGEVIILPKTYPARVAVQTGLGLLGFVTMQPEGKREMTGQEFIAGHQDFPGSIL